MFDKTKIEEYPTESVASNNTNKNDKMMKVGLGLIAASLVGSILDSIFGED